MPIAWNSLAQTYQPGTLGPGQTILVSPDFPDCQLLDTFRVWFCLVSYQPAYKINVTGWAPVDVNSPGCSLLKALMYPSGFPGPVDQDFVLRMFRSLEPVVSAYYFSSRDNYQSQYPCPSSFDTFGFIQGSCVKLVQSSFAASTPTISIDIFFKLAWCSFNCCLRTYTNCYNTLTGRIETSLVTSSLVSGACDYGGVIAPVQDGVVLSTQCRPMCPEPE